MLGLVCGWLSCLEGLIHHLTTPMHTGRLPTSYWDPVTKWKFDALLEMFRRNLDLDRELLAIQGQETRAAEGSEAWFGEPVQQQGQQPAGPGAGGGSTVAVVASQK